MDSNPTLMPSIASMRAHTLAGVVQYEIERMILSGELVAGERLNEKTIAERLSVSRGPVREACCALAELGLIRLVPNRGAFIRRLTRADAIETYDVRAGLTALAASLLAPVVGAGELAQLEQMVEDMEQAAQSGDFDTFHALNLGFHDAIVRATANSRVIKLYSSLVKEFHLLRTHGSTQSPALTESNREHREIVAALKAGDSRRSYEASFQHVNRGKQHMLLTFDDLASAEPGAAVGHSINI